MHLKKREITTPNVGLNRRDEGGYADARVCVWRTVAYRTDEGSSESGLFLEVYSAGDRWSVRVVGPRVPPKARLHDLRVSS